MKNIRSYNKMVRELKQGETFVCNTLNCSDAIIDQLILDVQNGVIKPNKEMLNEVVRPERIEYFMTGKSIYPEMMYIKC